MKVWPIPPEVRFWSRVDRNGSDGCWLWTASRDRHGYGMFQAHEGGSKLAHRWSYEHHVGPIPEGLVLDHLCRNPPCVNPTHLEAVTQAENARRGHTGWHNSLKTCCIRGHEFTPENTYQVPGGGRRCRVCQAHHNREYRLRQKIGRV